jgi:hypothetical protein
MTTRRTHTIKVVSAGAAIPLGELRWLVKELDGQDEKLAVVVRQDKGDRDPREPGVVSLEVTID